MTKTSFLYYLPEKDSTAGGKEIEAAGLVHAFRYHKSRPHVAVGVVERNGPDGKSGAIVARSDVDVKIGYHAEEQVWEVDPSGRFWVGYWKGRPPGPADLVRHETLRGYEVPLNDGNLWTIPIARGWSDSGEGSCYIALPQTRKLDQSGDWVHGRVLRRYEELHDAASQWWETWMGILQQVTDDSEVLTFTAETALAITALQTNYHLGGVEVSALELLDDPSTLETLHAMIDWPRVVEWNAKKNAGESDTLSTSSGATAERQATAPA